MRATFHLVAEEVWSAADATAPYEAASLGDEGFIHCTDGIDEMGVTFDRYYSADARGFLILTLDLDALDVPWRYDEAGSPYPHIYGAIRRSAIVSVGRIERDRGGRFVGLLPV